MVATDGMKLKLGDTTLTLYLTPGHTLGTISTLIPVKDNGTPHLVAEWGGTAFNWVGNRAAYITPERPDRFWFETYSKSAERFRDIAAKEGADIIIANHTIFDGSKTKLPQLAARKPGEQNPYVIGKEGVLRYMTDRGRMRAGGTRSARQVGATGLLQRRWPRKLENTKFSDGGFSRRIAEIRSSRSRRQLFTKPRGIGRPGPVHATAVSDQKTRGIQARTD